MAVGRLRRRPEGSWRAGAKVSGSQTAWGMPMETGLGREMAGGWLLGRATVRPLGMWRVLGTTTPMVWERAL
jgi:hypothetical protein